MERVILHDQRLSGRVEPGLGTVINCDANTPLATAFNRVSQTVRSSPAELIIACHGYVTHEYQQASHIEATGGAGLQLCRESYLLGNVSAIDVLAGMFRRIWLMACGPGGTAVDVSRPFCREMAHYAEATVIAGERSQLYYPGIHDDASQTCRPVLRFGAWEGKVFVFRPDGTIRPFEQSESPLP